MPRPPSPPTSPFSAPRTRGLASALAATLVLVLAAVLAVTGAGGASAQAETGRLSLFKRIENLDTGSSEGRRELWTMHARNLATGQTIDGDGLNGVQSLEVPAGTYRIWETGGVEGYRFQNWNCGGEDILDPTPEVVVPPGGTLTCTVDNEAIYPTLTLVKDVVGGTASPEDWTLRAQGPSSIAGPSGSDAVTGQQVRIGQYALSEEGGPDGYRSEGWTCDGADLVGDTVTIDLAASVTCTVTNVGPVDPTASTLTLVKEVVGGPAAAGDWTLTAVGPQTLSGTTGAAEVTAAEVGPGTYALAEDGPPGYDGTWACTGSAAGDGSSGAVAVPEGEDVVCTATNAWQGGTLTLVKALEGPTTAEPSDWALTATGADAVVSGASGSDAVTSVPVPAGGYELAEDGWSGFDPGPWACTGGPLDGDVVTVGTGADVTCTVTNTVRLPHLTLVKDVDGGPTAPQDWELSATGPQPGGGAGTIAGPSGSDAVSHVSVGAGEHTLAELTDLPGYEAGEWACTGATGQTGAVVAIGPEDDVVCTVTNTYTEATLTLVKDVVGGSADPAAWTLTATGEAEGAVVEGTTGSPGATDQHVPADTYELAESGGFGGYDTTGWACDGGTLTGTAVTLAPGDDVTCTVTNTARLPHLTLVKELDDRGYTGDAEPTDWTLAAVGDGGAISGATGTPDVSHAAVEPGRYVLGETGGPDGWTALRWTCDGARVVRSLDPSSPGGAVSTVVVAPGADATCTVTNHWQAGTLTLHKEVVDDAAPADDWTLGALGPDPVSGHDGSPDVTAVPVAAGTYVLGETSSDWEYEQLGWACEGGELVGARTVRVEDGADVVCTVTNAVVLPPTPEPTPTDPTPAPPPTDGPGPDETPGGPEGGPDGAGPGGDMAATGASVGALVAAALVALAAGGVLLALRRRAG